MLLSLVFEFAVMYRVFVIFSRRADVPTDEFEMFIVFMLAIDELIVDELIVDELIVDELIVVEFIVDELIVGIVAPIPTVKRYAVISYVAFISGASIILAFRVSVVISSVIKLDALIELAFRFPL